MNSENAKLFNTLVKYCEDNHYHKMQWTKSGGIRKGVGVFSALSYGIKQVGKTNIVLVISTDEGFYRFTFGIARKEQKDISGYTSFKVFKETCSKYDINIDDYAIDNGIEVKETFPIPPRKIPNKIFIDRELDNVHHIDLNSSFMSGLMARYSEFTPVVEELYSKRKENPIYKAILTHTYGYLQSALVDYKYINLSKAMVEFNNEFLNKLSTKLRESGRIIVSYNTDGIWYLGDIYHDEDEGTGLMKYKNDHINCKARFRSPSAYEFIEDGQYHAVLSGITKLDKIKSRDEWEWGDIYKCGNIETWSFNNDRIEYDEEVAYYG